MSGKHWTLKQIIIPLVIVLIGVIATFFAVSIDKEQKLTREAWNSVQLAQKCYYYGLYNDSILRLDEAYRFTYELSSVETQIEIRAYIYLTQSACELEIAEHTGYKIDNITRAIIASQNALDILAPEKFPVLRGWALYHLGAAYDMHFYCSSAPQDKKEALESYKKSLDFLPADNDICNEVLSRIKRLEQISRYTMPVH